MKSLIKKTLKNKDNLLSFLVIYMVLLIYISLFFSNQISVFILGACCLFFIFVCICFNYEKSFYTLMFFMCFQLPFIKTSLFSFEVNNVFIIIFDIIFVTKELIFMIKHNKKPSIPILCVSLMLILYGFINLNIKNLLPLISIIFILINFYLLYVNKNEVNILGVSKALVFGIILSSILCLGISKMNNIIGWKFYTYGRFRALCQNPNTLHMYCSIALACIFTLFLKRKINPFKFCITGGLVLIIGILTMSKAFLFVAFITSILFMVLDISCNRKNSLKEIVLFIFLGIVVAVLFHDKLFSILQRFTNSFGDGFFDKITTGRLAIWKKHILEWTSNWFTIAFGCGTTSYFVTPVGPHNDFVALLYRYGIIGCLLIVFLIITYVVNIKKSKTNRTNINGYLPLVIALFLSCEEVLCTISGVFIYLVAFTFLFGSSNINIKDQFVINDMVDNNLNKVAIIMPPFSLPADASRGGAIEQLISTIITKNEEEKKFNLFIISTEKTEKQFVYTQNIQIKTNVFMMKLKAGFFTVLKKFKLTQSKRYSCKYYDIARNCCEKLCPDYIIFESKFPKNIEMFTKLFTREKLIYHIHNYEHDKLDYSKYFSGIITVSDFIKKDIENNVSFSHHISIEVLKNCLTSSSFYNICSEKELLKLKANLGFQKDDFVILYCGRLNKDKGPDILIKSLFNTNKKIKLLIVGESFFKSSKKTKYVKYLESLTKQIPGRTRFTGYIKNSELFKYYQMADLQVIPTMCEEAAGMVALEGKVSKVSQIITESGGLAEYAAKSAIVIKRDENIINNMKNAIQNLFTNKIVLASDYDNIYDQDFYYKTFYKILNKKGKNYN